MWTHAVTISLLLSFFSWAVTSESASFGPDSHWGSCWGSLCPVGCQLQTCSDNSNQSSSLALAVTQDIKRQAEKMHTQPASWAVTDTERERQESTEYQAMLWVFHQVYGPVLAQHFWLGLELCQVHLQVRESACWLSSLIHRHQLQQRICLEYCYASRKGAVLLWSRQRTEAGMLRSSMLFELEAAEGVCCPIWEFACRTVD